MQPKRAFILAAALLLGAVTTNGQRTGRLSQKLLLENTIQQRVTSAVSKIIDESRFVIDVKIELAFSAAQRPDQTAYGTPGGGLIREPESAPATGTVSTVDPGAIARGQRGRITTNPFPIPGFPDVVSFADEEPVRVLDEEADSDAEMGAEPLEPEDDFADFGAAGPDLSGSGEMPQILSMSLNIILEDGVSPQTIENVRQVALVASRYDRDRGDILSITTASFRDRPAGSRSLIALGDDPVSQAAQQKADAENAELRETLRIAEQRNEDLLQEIRKREMEYLQQSEEERKKALADLAEVQNERAKDLIFLQQQREESNLKLQDALLNQIDQLRKEMTSGLLSQREQNIKTFQAASLEDSLVAMRRSFDAEKERLQAQIEAALNPEPIRSPGLSGLLENGQGLVLLGMLLFMGFMVAVLLAMRSRAAVQPAVPAYPAPYPTRRRRRPLARKKAPSKKVIPEPDEPAPEPVVAAAPEPVAEPAPEGPLAAEAAEEAKPQIQEDDETDWTPGAPRESAEVQQSDLSTIRQSVVSMSVGRQETAARILSDWLHQDEGSETAGEATDDQGAAGPDEETASTEES